MKMTSNGKTLNYKVVNLVEIYNFKTLNYKVVNLVEIYNFHIRFTSIRVQTKKLKVFENRLDP
jgi:hypothetical protein